MELKRWTLLLFWFININIYGQELKVVEPLHRDLFEVAGSNKTDSNGEPCALVKVQLPIQDVVFEGNVVESRFLVNEYWVFLTAGTKKFRIKCPKAHPIDIDVTNISPKGLKSNCCYTVKLTLSKESSAESVNNSDVPIKEYYIEDFVTNAFGLIPINSVLKDSKTTYETVKAVGLNPTLKSDGDVGVFMTSHPEKCKGFNAVKMKCKIDGCDIIPESTSMGYEPSKYDDGRITYQFSWTHDNNSERRKFGREQSINFAKFILQGLINAGYHMEGMYNNAKCLTRLGEITLVCNDNYGSCWVGLYVDTYRKLEK